VHFLSAALRVYTPAESAIDNQEFLGPRSDSITSEAPEPSSSLLLASGLLVLAAMFRKRFWIRDSRE
jgi:hypothetical protein